MRSGTLLVTGGAGYVGSHFVARLEDDNERYIVLDDLSHGRESFVPKGKLVHGDIADAQLVETLCREHGVDAVVHFAAFAYVGESVGDPARYYENNVVKSIALINALRRADVRRFVFSSSCATYGEPPGAGTLAETAPQNPINPYGRTKLVVERLLSDYEAAYGLRSVSLRYFNAAGASERHPLFEQHDPETHLIPLAVDAALGTRTLEIFGNDYATPDGTCIRDYVHVDDLAVAHARAVDRLRSEGDSLRANLGIGRGASVMEIVESIESAAGAKVRYGFAPRRPGDPPALIADPTLARRELGWEPRYRDVNEIVATAIVGYGRAHS